MPDERRCWFIECGQPPAVEWQTVVSCYYHAKDLVMFLLWATRP